MADSGIITMEEYGNVRLKLKERMDSDGINRNTLARRIGVRFEVVDKWYRGDVEKLDLDISGPHLLRAALHRRRSAGISPLT